MPRWASRITLEIESVGVEWLQDISEDDAIAEGCQAVVDPQWWQGYQEFDGDLTHTQHPGDEPPAWMIEPKKMRRRDHLKRTARYAYRVLWNQINGADSWEDNPFVWVINFKRIKP